MNNTKLERLIDLLYPLFLSRLKKEGFIKNSVRSKNATVTSELAENEHNIDKQVKVIFPFDTTSFPVINRTGVDLIKGDTVCVEYWIDLKNAVAVYKIER